VERRATGEWVNDIARRSRHLGLFLIAISQQLSDFAGPYGKALLRNSTQQLFLRQSPDELAYIKEAVRLSDAEVAAIARLKTVKRSYSQAYWINGTRGRGTIALRVGPTEYALATSDPVGDRAGLQRGRSRLPGQRVPARLDRRPGVDVRHRRGMAHRQQRRLRRAHADVRRRRSRGLLEPD